MDYLLVFNITLWTIVSESLTFPHAKQLVQRVHFTPKVFSITTADFVSRRKEREKEEEGRKKDTRDHEICNPTKCPRDGKEKAHSSVHAYRQIELWEKTDDNEIGKGDGEVSIMRR